MCGDVEAFETLQVCQAGADRLREKTGRIIVYIQMIQVRRPDVERGQDGLDRCEPILIQIRPPAYT